MYFPFVFFIVVAPNVVVPKHKQSPLEVRSLIVAQADAQLQTAAQTISLSADSFTTRLFTKYQGWKEPRPTV